MKPFPIARRWAIRVNYEFFLQVPKKLFCTLVQFVPARFQSQSVCTSAF
jgi:hypothetical protein